MAKSKRIECPWCHKKVAIDKNNKLCVHSDLIKQGLCPNSNLVIYNVREMTHELLRQLSKHPDNTWCDLNAIRM